MGTVRIRLSAKPKSKLDQQSHDTGRDPSAIVRDALRRQLMGSKTITPREPATLTAQRPREIERDAMGWPTAFWSLEGSAPEFDVGDRGR